MPTEIALSRGYVTVVDDCDAALVVASGPWNASDCGGLVYARRWHRGTTQSLHTMLTGWARVDHRNGDGLDNRRANLRPATHAENMANRGAPQNNTSGFKGVTAYRTGRWRASITVAGRHQHLGYFDTPELAAAAYDSAALAAFGEYARLNLPLETP